MVNVAVVLTTSRLGGSIFSWMDTLEADVCPFILARSVEADGASGSKPLFCRDIGLVEAAAAGMGIGLVES